MIPITYNEVVAAVVKRADIDPPGLDTFITTAQMDMLVQVAGESLFCIMQEVDPALFQGVLNVSTTAGQAHITLPAFVAAVDLAGWVQGDAVTALRRASPEEWFAFGASSRGWESAFPPYYRVQSWRMEFYPAPQTVEPVRILYTERTMIGGAGDEFDGTANMFEYLVLHVCSRVMQAQEKDDTLFLRSLADMEIRLRKPGVRIDKNALHTVRDVEGANVRARFGWL